MLCTLNIICANISRKLVPKYDVEECWEEVERGRGRGVGVAGVKERVRKGASHRTNRSHPLKEITRRSVEHCTPHADGAGLNELGWSQ